MIVQREEKLLPAKEHALDSFPLNMCHAYSVFRKPSENSMLLFPKRAYDAYNSYTVLADPH